jgi:5'-phosphate synthase pdxT subunit
VESFETTLDMPVIGDEPVAAAFISAPIIRDAGEADVIAQLPNGDVVGVRHENRVGISFHPEVIGETRVHRWWLDEVVVPAKR